MVVVLSQCYESDLTSPAESTSVELAIAPGSAAEWGLIGQVELFELSIWRGGGCGDRGPSGFKVPAALGKKLGRQASL